MGFAWTLSTCSASYTETIVDDASSNSANFMFFKSFTGTLDVFKLIIWIGLFERIYIVSLATFGRFSLHIAGKIVTMNVSA